VTPSPVPSIVTEFAIAGETRQRDRDVGDIEYDFEWCAGSASGARIRRCRTTLRNIDRVAQGAVWPCGSWELAK